jgi:hypothetical protein
MLRTRRRLALVALAMAAVPAFLLVRARGSDHADTPAIAASPGTDLTDVYVFPSPNNANNVVLAMNVHPLIPAGMGASTVFDPNVLYQFKIDNTGDNVEDLVIQAKFTGTNPLNQTVQIYGPGDPNSTGTVTSYLDAANPTMGHLNQTFQPTLDMQAFAGAREDPFFFDLERFFQILPDRATPVNGIAVPPAQANVPQAASWRAPGAANDFLYNLNVLSIVVELPKAKLTGTGDGKIRVWCTTSR